MVGEGNDSGAAYSSLEGHSERIQCAITNLARTCQYCLSASVRSTYPATCQSRTTLLSVCVAGEREFATRVSGAYINRPSSQVKSTFPGFKSRCNIDFSC